MRLSTPGFASDVDNEEVGVFPRRGAEQVQRLAELPLNFDVPRTPAAADWHIDDFRQQLRAEPPGEPLPGGTWEVACSLVRHYEFADPTLVQRVHHSSDTLAESDLLLVTRFYGLTFRLPCRVGEVVDDTASGVRRWGWNYRTLQGHLEQGQMGFSVRKDLTSGAVEFRVQAYSRAAPIANPVVRLGFELFGRSTQLRFIRGACHRMAALSDPAKNGPPLPGPSRGQPAAGGPGPARFAPGAARAEPPAEGSRRR